MPVIKFNDPFLHGTWVQEVIKFFSLDSHFTRTMLFSEPKKQVYWLHFVPGRAKNVTN